MTVLYWLVCNFISHLNKKCCILKSHLFDVTICQREEKKRDVMDGEVSLQRMQLQYRVLLTPPPRTLVCVIDAQVWHLVLILQHETELLEESLGLPGFPPATTSSYKFGSSDEELMDSDDYTSTHVRTRPSVIPNSRFTNSNLNASQPGGIKQEVRRRHSHHNWLHKLVITVSLSLFSCYN